MIITKIENQKKNKNRYSVYIDEKFAFGIDEFDLMKLKLKTGIEISKDTLDEIKNTVLLSSAKDYALSLVSRFTYTKKSMTDKLKLREYDPEIIEKTIEFLENYKYIDDFDFAKRYIADALKIKNYGVSKIVFELSRKGISKDIIDLALTEFDTFDLEKEGLLPLAKKKLGGNFEYKNILKTKRFLISKGYSYELIDIIINQIVNEEGEC